MWINFLCYHQSLAMRLDKMKKGYLGNWLALEKKMLNIKTNGKSLIELTAYRGIALWWFVRFRLVQARFGLVEPSQLVKSLTKSTYFISFADFLYDFVTSILCRAFSTYSRVETGKKRKLKVLVTAQNVQWKNLLDLNGRLKKGDAFFDPIIAELRKRDYDIVTVYPLNYSFSGLKTIIDKFKKQKGVTHKAFNIYWSMKIWKKAFDARRYFKKVWSEIFRKDVRIVHFLERYGLENEIKYCFTCVFERVIKRIEMANKLIEQEKPDLILLINEYGVFERALVVVGKLKGIPTLAVQHGNIGPLHMGYMYSKDSISVSGSARTPYCPIPEKTAVYGQYYYDLLTKMSAYPPSSVVVTGQPRYDTLVMADRGFRREKFCARLGLLPDRKIVLVATQPWSMPIRKAFLRSVLTALKCFPEVQAIIKPHPREKEGLYKKVVEKENAEVAILPSKSDTFEALHACDLLVAGFSTVITEALILGKPAVTVGLASEEPTPFYKGVTLRVNKDEDPTPAIRNALYDKKTREKFKKERKKFVSRYAHKQDGRATERVINLIERMIKERRLYGNE